MATKDAKPAKPAAPKAAAKKVKVRALRDGYYANKFRRTGDVFWIDGSTHAEVCKRVGATPKPGKENELGYLGSWMELVDEKTPERITNPNDVLEEKRNERRLAQASGTAPATGDLDPIGEDA